MAAPSIQDLREQGRTVLIVRRPDLSVDVGDISAMLLDIAVAMADVSLGTIAGDVAATYLSGARGDKLSLLTSDHFDTDREEKTAAVGTCTFIRASGVLNGTLPAGTRVATEPEADGSFVEATTDTDLVWAAETTQDVACTVTTIGREGNVEAAEFTRILDTGLFDTFTVTNAEAFAGGNEAQDDDSLVEQARDREATLQKAVKEAIEFGARTVSSVRVATAIMVNSMPTVFVSDADGGSNAEMVSDVEAVMEQWQAFGVEVVVTGGVLVSQSIDVSLTVRTGVDVSALSLRVRQAIVSAVNRLKNSETLRRGLIETAVRNVDRDSITNVTINTPAADIQPNTGEIIRTSLALVSVS